MNLTVICKASTKIGLGHLIRTTSFINQILLLNPHFKINYYIIGDPGLKKMVSNEKIKCTAVKSESEVLLKEVCDCLFLDMIELEKASLMEWKKKCKKLAVLSPIFNLFEAADFYFGRTKYLDFNVADYPNLQVYAGLEYAIIQENCKVISAGVYEDNLNSQNFPIAIAMGGGDATNKTLQVLNALKKCKVPATFWVMVGEGYKHSIDDLVSEIRKDTSHEIILAKTNTSMWKILNNCVLCILPGGITSYEAVYAGLPSINFFEFASQRFLLKELVEQKAAFDFGIFSDETLEKIVEFIEKLYKNRKELLQMHVNTKMIIDNLGAQRIINIIKEN